MVDIYAKLKARRTPLRAPIDPERSRKALARLNRARNPDNPVNKEIERIVGLPLVHPVSPEEAEEFCRTNTLAEAYNDDWRLFECQVGAVLAYDLYDGGFLPIGVGWGKCVVGTTEVYDVATGRRRSVQDPGPVTVASLRESDKRIQARPAKVFPSGQKPCLRVRLQHGQELELSTDHKVFTQRGWVEARDLIPYKDKIATPATLPHPQQLTQISDESVVLAAYMMADGSTAGNAMRFTQQPGPVLEEFKYVVGSLGGETSLSAANSSGRAEDWNVRGLRPWARDLGLANHKATNKRLPADFYGLPDRQCALFLSRFWACDGWLEQDRASVALANRPLLEDIRHLLLRLGITARVEYKPTGQFSAWRLVVSGGTNLQRFMDALGEIPGKPWGTLKTRPSKNVGYDGDVRWVSVRQVHSIGVQPVYDLEVPETHNFVANGMVVHNTLISLMIAERAHRRGIKTLLLVPSQVYPQLVNNDIPWARRKVPLSVPFVKLGGKSQAQRMRWARSGQAGCYILPYSLLSTEDTSLLLDLISPGLVIADEAHFLKNAKSARTGRLFGRKGYMTSNPTTQFVAMSGTITSRSIVDYWHLIRAALKDNSPLPLSGHIIRQWAGVLDAKPVAGILEGKDSDFHTEPIMPLVRWAKRNWPGEEFPESTRGFRASYRRRLMHAPGVVVTGDNEIGTSLLLSAQEVQGGHLRAGWDTLEDFEHDVRELWKAPNGDEIDHAMHSYKWLYELSAGFYNDLYWPAPEVLAAERNLTVGMARDLLDRAKHHHMLKQLYHKQLRQWLTNRARPGLDTPFLVAGDMDRHEHKNVGRDLFESWQTMHEAAFDGMPERRKRPVRVCDYKVQAAANWAAQVKGGGILWYHHQEIGRWLMELLPDALHCPAGKEHDASIVDKKNHDRIVVASISAHGLGKNLQHFHQQYVVQWPRSAVSAEQMLGRTHRNGQEADELNVILNTTTVLDQDNFAACLNDALYIHATTGVRQKLMYASYDPLPAIISPRELRKRGLSPKHLTGSQIMELKEKFGKFTA